MSRHTAVPLRIVLLLIWLLPFCGGPASAAPLHVGDIGNQPVDQMRRFSPFLNYLIKHLQSEGIDQGRVIVVKNIPEMATALREGRVDIFIDSAYPAVALVRLAGAKILLRRWKRDLADYHGVIFVRRDSGIDQLEDLKGKIIGFEEPYSTITYFVPKLAMIQKGLKLTPKRDESEPVSSNEVGYIFVGDDPNTMVWVLKGRASAGVLSNQGYQLEARANREALKVIHETFTIPRQVVGYRADLPPRLVARIRDILVKMHESEEGRKVLKQFENTTKFDEVPDRSLTPLLNSMHLIDAELGSR